MNRAAKPKKVTPAELAKLLTAQRADLYELTLANAVPTVAEMTANKRARERHYLLSVIE